MRKAPLFSALYGAASKNSVPNFARAASAVAALVGKSEQ